MTHPRRAGSFPPSGASILMLSAHMRAVRDGRGFDPATFGATFRFGAPDDLEAALLPRLLDRLETGAPGVRVVVRPADFHHIAERLGTGDADAVLSALPRRPLDARHRRRVLHRERFAVLHDVGLVPEGAVLDLETWLATPQAMVSIDGERRSSMDEALAEHDRRRRRVAIAVPHFPALPSLLRGRRLLANVPAASARHLAAEHGLEVSALPFDGPSFELALC